MRSATDRTEQRGTPRVLVLSSVELPLGEPPPGKPRPDYLQIVEQFDADILDGHNFNPHGNRLLALVNRLLGVQFAIALLVMLRAHRYAAIIAMSDHVGLPAALLLKLSLQRRPLYVACQNMNSRSPIILLRRIRVDTAVRRFLYLSEPQRRLLEELYPIPPEKLFPLKWHIDHRFFAPQPETEVRRQICSVGMANRDYATLVAATRGLDVDVKLDVNSAWYAEKTNLDDSRLHDRVEVRTGRSTVEMRRLVAESLFVVVPLTAVPRPAGYTAILEAMAMGKAVIATRTVQGADFPVDGHSGFLVDPCDVAGLRERIQYLLDNPDEARRMGENARRLIEEAYTLEHFGARLKAALCLADEMAGLAPQPLTAPAVPADAREG